MLRAGIYIGWVGFLNLGDETMYELCHQRFARVHWARIEEIAYAPHPAQFVARSANDSRRILQALTEEIFTRRSLVSLVTKTMHKLSQQFGREVGIYGGGTVINRNAAALENYVSVRKRSGSPVPTFGTSTAGWTGEKEWVAVLAELPVAGCAALCRRRFSTKPERATL